MLTKLNGNNTSIYIYKQLSSYVQCIKIIKKKWNILQDYWFMFMLCIFSCS